MNRNMNGTPATETRNIWIARQFDGDEFDEAFDTREEAEKAARYAFNHLTDRERARTTITVELHRATVPAGDARTAAQIYSDMLDDGSTEILDAWERFEITQQKPMARVSIDNGRTWVSPAEAVTGMAWDVIVNSMDDEIRESVAADLAPCSEAEFLAEYLRRAGSDLVIG